MATSRHSCKLNARALLPLAMLILAIVRAGELAAAGNSDTAITTPKNSAQELLKKVVDNELAADKADQADLWTYISDTRDSSGEISEKVVETQHGILTLKLAINGKKLSEEDERRQRQHIQSLVEHPRDAVKEFQDQTHDADQSEQMLRLLPQALLAKYGQNRGDLQEIDFTPNPKFHPSSHEAEVFQAMAGMILVDKKENRLAEIDGHLTYRVEFGWGVLGHLNKGGRFHVVQKEVLPGHWEIVRLLVDMRGKALFFKSISVQQNETRTDYKLLPPNITLAQGAKMIVQ